MKAVIEEELKERENKKQLIERRARGKAERRKEEKKDIRKVKMKVEKNRLRK